MKKCLLSILISSSLLLSACGDDSYGFSQNVETKEYYLAHIEQAKEVNNFCYKEKNRISQLRDSIQDAKEKNRFDKEAENFYKNCREADSAIMENERKIREENQAKAEAEEKLRIEKEEAEKKVQQEKRKAEVEEFIKTEETKYKFSELTWSQQLTKSLNELYRIRQGRLPIEPTEVPSLKLESSAERFLSFDDTTNYIEQENSLHSHHYTERYNENKEYNFLTAIYLTAARQGFEELSQKPYNELLNETHCKTDKRYGSVCNIWEVAVNTARNNFVNHYVEDYEALKKDYNQCTDKMDNFLKKEGYPEGIKTKQVSNDVFRRMNDKHKEISNSYPCAETLEALQRLNLSVQDVFYSKLD